MKDTPEVRLLKEIAKSINWQNKRIAEIETMLQALIKPDTSVSDERMVELAFNALTESLTNDDTDGEPKE